eukprot:2146413-Lingulodinium_polyedra.AAC.1
MPQRQQAGPCGALAIPRGALWRRPPPTPRRPPPRCQDGGTLGSREQRNPPRRGARGPTSRSGCGWLPARG